MMFEIYVNDNDPNNVDKVDDVGNLHDQLASHCSEWQE